MSRDTKILYAIIVWMILLAIAHTWVSKYIYDTELDEVHQARIESMEADVSWLKAVAECNDAIVKALDNKNMKRARSLLQLQKEEIINVGVKLHEEELEDLRAK